MAYLEGFPTPPNELNKLADCGMYLLPKFRRMTNTEGVSDRETIEFLNRCLFWYMQRTRQIEKRYK